jgi:prephenate dehydrogenase
MTKDMKITKKMQFDVIRAVRKQLQAIQAAVRAEDRESAQQIAEELSATVLQLRTDYLNAQLLGQP